MSKLFDKSCTLYSSNIYTVNLISQERKKNSSQQQSGQILESVMQWFQGKGVAQGNPEDILNCYHSPLKVQMKQKIRKMSAPCQNAILARRKSKDVINAYA